MDQENTNPYEDYYLEQLDNNQQNSQNKVKQHTTEQQTEELYYRSLQEYYPKLEPCLLYTSPSPRDA